MLSTYQEAVIKSTEYFNGDEMAAANFVGKYALRDGDNFLEETPDDMHDRLAREFSRIEQRYPNPLSESQIREMLHRFKKIVPQGSPMFGIGNHIDLVSLSNCFVIASPDDTMSSIYDRARELANLFKRRAGVGLDLSTLRPEGAKVKNSAKKSSGAWSFADFYSYVCRCTGQNGRRGALMLSMHVWHPDIEKFITMKHDLTKVTGANISVMLSDDFMQAVKNKAQWPLVFNGTVYKTVDAEYLWDLICSSATNTAEPGLIFIDNYRKNMPLNYYEGFEMVCVNPCGEIGLSPYDSCRLMAINIAGFVKHPYKTNASFDIDSFKETVRISMRLMDDLVDLEIECLNKIIENCDTEDEANLFAEARDAATYGRRTGLGTTGIADALFSLGIRYDSVEALIFADRIFAILRDIAYHESINLAKERGAFPMWNPEVEKNCEFFTRFNPQLLREMNQYGRRNGTLLTNAPTGTVSTLTQTSSGIEPIIFASYKRWKKLTTEEEQHLSVDRIDATGDKWHQFTVYHHALEQYWKANDLPIGSVIPDHFVTAENIDWERRIQMQSTMQQYIDHGISSTINLPKGTPVDVVKNLYELAWIQGLKGVTVYVDGSRDAVMEKVSTSDENWFERPQYLECEIHHPNVKTNHTITSYVIFVGLKNGLPFEVFGGKASEVPEIQKHHTSGVIEKHKLSKENKYTLTCNGNCISELGQVFKSGDQATINRLVSIMLRRGIELHYIIDQLLKETEADLFNYNKVLARVLKKYLVENTASSNRCPSCGSKELRYIEGCHKCLDCGYSGCS